MENMETESIKMGADELAENTPNPPNLSAQIVWPSPKVWEVDEKKYFIGRPESVVRASADALWSFVYVAFRWINSRV